MVSTHPQLVSGLFQLLPPRPSWPLHFLVLTFPILKSGLIHKESNSDAEYPAYYALATFEPEISHCTSPAIWLQSDFNYINTIIQGVISLTQRSEIEDANFAETMIYQVGCAARAHRLLLTTVALAGIQ